MKKGILVLEKGILVLRKGTLVLEKGTLVLEKGILVSRKGTLVSSKGTLLFHPIIKDNSFETKEGSFLLKESTAGTIGAGDVKRLAAICYLSVELLHFTPVET